MRCQASSARCSSSRPAQCTSSAVGGGAVQRDRHRRRDARCGRRRGPARGRTAAHRRRPGRATRRDGRVGRAEAVAARRFPACPRDRQREPAADHRARLDEPARSGRAAPRGRRRVAHAPGRPARLPRPVGDGAGDLADEERVAAGDVVHLVGGGTTRAQRVELSCYIGADPSPPTATTPHPAPGPSRPAARRAAAESRSGPAASRAPAAARPPPGRRRGAARAATPRPPSGGHPERSATAAAPPASNTDPATASTTRKRSCGDDWTSPDRGAPTPNRFKTSSHGQNGGAPAVSAQRPHTTRSR